MTYVRWVSAMVLVLVAACGGADIGEECEMAGSTDECVDGAICTNDSDGTFCREICDSDADCPNTTDWSCNGITSTSIKSCQPK